MFRNNFVKIIVWKCLENTLFYKMEKTIVWQIIQVLPSGALLEIEKMTRSPFFNQREDVILLFKALKKAVKSTNIPSREHIFAQINPGESFNSADFRVTLHFLQQILFQYLSYKKNAENEAQQALLLSQSLRELSLDHIAQSVLAKSEEMVVANNRMQDPDIQDRRFQFIVESLKSAGSGGSRSRNLNLQHLSTQLDKSFILRKLKTSCELLSHQAVMKVEYDYGILPMLLEYISNDPEFRQSQEVQLYYNCYLALKNPGEAQYFQAMKPVLMQVESIFQPSECRDIVLLALNYCIRRLNAGDSNFAKEGLDLYANALEKGYLLEKGELDRFTFRNVVAMGLVINSFDWVEQFIDTYGVQIAVPYRESMVSFSRARLAYSRKNYKEAMLLLQKADYDDLLLNLAAKTMLMKMYVETGEDRLLDSLLDSMSIFLRRKKVIGYHKTNYLNIVKYGRRLLTLNRFDSSAVAGLRQAVQEETHLTEKVWFLEQLTRPA